MGATLPAALFVSVPFHREGESERENEEKKTGILFCHTLVDLFQ